MTWRPWPSAADTPLNYARPKRPLMGLLEAMGSKVALGPGKSVAFASTKHGRRQLRIRAAEARAPGAKEVARQWRDLGSHARPEGREVGVTGRGRLCKAAKLIPAVCGLLAGQWLLNKLLAQKLLMLALYGSEATP